MRQPVDSIPVSSVFRREKRIRLYGQEILLLLLSALLFALSFPNFLYKWGFFPLAFIALVPVFVVVHRSGWFRIFVYGLFYGFISYVLFNYWLKVWHPLAIFVVPVIYAGYFLLVLPLLKLADRFFPRYGYLVQTVIWIAYEFIKTQGFLGYSYGILGYTQYPFLPFIRLSSLTGVWGVSLLVIFTSAFLGNAVKKGWPEFLPFVKKNGWALILYSLIFTGSVCFGLATRSDYKDVRHWKVALVQQNIDPWRGGFATYDRALNVLTQMSRKALEDDPEIIVWSETSFVPGIEWHTKFRTDEKSYQIVKRLKDFLEGQSVAYVIGNNDVNKRVLTDGREIRINYNATILYRENSIADIYRKLHLVQFAEHFPYQGMWSWLRDLLIGAGDIHWYEKGDIPVIFEDRGVRFATPLCFEDTFGYLNREFIRKGADVLVNMTNDSWSQSVVCEIQHMTMAVFRATENKRPIVRSTNGGITCIIDSNGRIRDQLDPFVAGYLVGDVPIESSITTLYNRWGDWMGFGCVFIMLGCMLFGGVRYYAGRSEKSNS